MFDLKQFHINKFTVSIFYLLFLYFFRILFSFKFFDSNFLTSKNNEIDKQLERISALEYENINQANELKKYEEIINNQVKENEKD